MIKTFFTNIKLTCYCVFDFINKEILPQEKSVTYDSISENFKDDYLPNGQKI